MSRENFFKELTEKVIQQLENGELDKPTAERYLMTINRIDGGPVSRHFVDNPVAQQNWEKSVKEMQNRYGFFYGFLPHTFEDKS